MKSQKSWRASLAHIRALSQTRSDPVNLVEWNFGPGSTDQCSIASKEAFGLTVRQEGKNNDE
jgi:hypothetical protein